MKRIVIIAFLALLTCACNDPFMPGYDASLHRTGITAAEVPVLRTIFEAQFQALLHLEDAKLHGKRKAGRDL